MRNLLAFKWVSIDGVFDTSGLRSKIKIYAKQNGLIVPVPSLYPKTDFIISWAVQNKFPLKRVVVIINSILDCDKFAVKGLSIQ